MVQNLNLTMRSGYVLSLKVLRSLPVEDRVVLRQAGLLLVAHEMLATFHRSPALLSVSVRIDYSPEDPEDRYDASARNGFFTLEGDETPPWEHGLKDALLPLELLSSGTFTLRRDDPLVQLSLTDVRGRDRLLHHRVVHQVAVEMDIAIPFP